VNGQPQQANNDSTLSDIARLICDRDTGIAIAVNNEVVPRSGWGVTVPNHGDRVDVVTAVQGG
jgi:sulfur carrier protein